MRPILWTVLPLVLLGGCSAAQRADRATPALACSLTPDDLRNRRDALLPGLIRRADVVKDLEDGLRLEFRSRPGLLAEIAKVMEQERTCCTFLRFQLTAEPEGGSIILDVTGPKGTREVLRTL